MDDVEGIHRGLGLPMVDVRFFSLLPLEYVRITADMTSAEASERLAKACGGPDKDGIFTLKSGSFIDFFAPIAECKVLGGGLNAVVDAFVRPSYAGVFALSAGFFICFLFTMRQPDIFRVMAWGGAYSIVLRFFRHSACRQREALSGILRAWRRGSAF
jgi:hypothetical protein